MSNEAIENSENLDELRAFFFKENIRLNEANILLEEEREALAEKNAEYERELKHLRTEQELFNKELDILKKELYRMAVERKALEREKARIAEMKSKAEREMFASRGAVKGSMFFSGVCSELALKKRYKDLIKIYHPDNLGGDTDTIQCINREYDSLKKRYCG